MLLFSSNSDLLQELSFAQLLFVPKKYIPGREHANKKNVFLNQVVKSNVSFSLYFFVFHLWVLRKFLKIFHGLVPGNIHTKIHNCPSNIENRGNWRGVHLNPWGGTGWGFKRNEERTTRKSPEKHLNQFSWNSYSISAWKHWDKIDRES